MEAGREGSEKYSLEPLVMPTTILTVSSKQILFYTIPASSVYGLLIFVPGT